MDLKGKQLEFGPFRVDGANQQLFDRRKAIPLPPKAYDTLLFLLENSRRLVTRDELMKAVWPNSFVEDGNLSVNIFQLRKVLGDMPDGRPYIETVPRRGYRFLAEVKMAESGVSPGQHGGPAVLQPREEPPPKVLSGGETGTAPAFLSPKLRETRAASAVAHQESLPEVIAFPEAGRREGAQEAPPRDWTPEPGAGEDSPRRPARWRALAAVLCLIAAAVVAGWFLWSRGRPTRPLTQRQLTSFAPQMAVTAAAISNGSKFIAYANPAGLFIQIIATGETHALALPEAHFNVSSIGWFPDSAELLVDGSGPADAAPSMWIVPVIGTSPPVKLGSYPAGALSPDGSKIAWINRSAAAPEIQLMPSQGGEIRTLVTGNVGETFASVSWYPGDRRLLFVRYRWNPQFRSNSGSVDSYDLGSGAIRTVIAGRNFGGNAVCLPDGRVVYSRLHDEDLFAGASELMEVQSNPQTGTATGAPRPLARWSAPVTDITINSSGKRLALRDLAGQQNIYIAGLNHSAARLDSVRQFSFGVGREDLPQAWSPDSQSIFFDTNRNGHWQVYKRALNSEASAPFVSGPEDQFAPRVSPDGAWLLYIERPVNWREPEPARVMRVSISGGLPQPVLSATHFSDWGLRFDCPRRPDAPCLLAQRQGNYVVFRSFDPIKGFEPPASGIASISVHGAVDWAVKPDGSSLAWIEQNPRNAMIHVLPLALGPKGFTAGKERNAAVVGWSHLHSINWAPGGRGWFLVASSAASWTLLYAGPQGDSRTLLKVQSDWPPDVYPSPDGRHLAFSERTFGSNVWLLANF